MADTPQLSSSDVEIAPQLSASDVEIQQSPQARDEQYYQDFQKLEAPGGPFSDQPARPAIDYSKLPPEVNNAIASVPRPQMKTMDVYGDIPITSATAPMDVTRPDQAPLTQLGKPAGLRVPGNIDLNNRPVVQNADGTHSTEFSTSFGTDKGEVLVPTVVNGRFLTPDGKKPAPGSQAEKDLLGYTDSNGVFHKGEAQKYYERTGQHMGIFDTPEHADAYANQVHNRGAAPQQPYSYKRAIVGGLTDVLTTPEIPEATAAVPPLGPQAAQGAEELATPGKRVRGALRLGATGLEAATPFIGPAAIESPMNVARGVAEGYVAGKGAKKVAKMAGAEPETQELAENVGQLAPMVGEAVFRPRLGVATTPEGTAVSAGVRGAGAGVAVTPEETVIRGKVGPIEKEVRIPRNGAKPPEQPALTPQTIEGELAANPPTRDEIADAQAATDYAGPDQAKAAVVAKRQADRAAASAAPPSGPEGAKAAGAVETRPTPSAPAPAASPATPELTSADVEMQPERRANVQERKRVDQMTPEEMQQELLTSKVTGLPNRRAFDEAEKPAAAGMSDADGLKAFNDKFGYDAGNALLQAKADALREAGLDAYHDKGDEFLYRGASVNDLNDKLEKAREILRNKEISIELKDGSQRTLKGVDFSYGTGADLSEAESGLKSHKAEREAKGERARGELRGITETPAGIDNEGQRQAGKLKRSEVEVNLPPEAQYKHRSTQFNIPEESEAHGALETARSRISDSDLSGQGKDVGGNHVTVRYGLTAKDDDELKKLKGYISSLEPFEATLGKTEKFPPSESSDNAAVIHAPIESPELQKINKELENHAPYIEPTFKDYKPHATIAYVRPDRADRYVGMNVTNGKKFRVESIAITDRHGNQTEVPLNGQSSTKLETEAGNGRAPSRDNEGKVLGPELHPAIQGQEPNAGGNRQESQNTTLEQHRQPPETGEILGGIQRGGIQTGAPTRNGEETATKVVDIGARASQEPRYAGQSRGESGTFQQSTAREGTLPREGSENGSAALAQGSEPPGTAVPDLKALEQQRKEVMEEMKRTSPYGQKAMELRQKHNNLLRAIQQREDEIAMAAGQPTRAERRTAQKIAEEKAFNDRPQKAMKYGDLQQSQHWQVLERDFIDKRFQQEIDRYNRAIPEQEQKIKELGQKTSAQKVSLEKATLVMWKEIQKKNEEHDPRKAQKFKEEYRKLVKEAVSHGRPVPHEVIAQHPEFKLAEDARERYEKGRHTSFANRSAAINDTMQKEEGFKVKRQDGKPITDEQIKEISTGVDEMVKVLGPELREMMRGTDLTISHTSGKHPFLSDAGGQYHPLDRSISAGINNFLGKPIKALAHETGHWLDYEAGRLLNSKAYIRPKGGGPSTETKYISEADRSTKPLYELARRTMSDTYRVQKLIKTTKLSDLPEQEREEIEVMKVVLGPYWHEPRELWARMFEQYIATKLDSGGVSVRTPHQYQTAPAYWPKEAWAKIEPLFDEALKTRMDAMRERYAPTTIKDESEAEPAPAPPPLKAAPAPTANYGWDASKMAANLTLDELNGLEHEIQSDPLNRNKPGSFNIYTPTAKKKLDAITWAKEYQRRGSLSAEPAKPSALAIQQAEDAGRQAGQARRRGDDSLARDIATGNSKYVDSQPAAIRKELVDAFNRTYREEANKPTAAAKAKRKDIEPIVGATYQPKGEPDRQYVVTEVNTHPDWRGKTVKVQRSDGTTAEFSANAIITGHDKLVKPAAAKAEREAGKVEPLEVRAEKEGAQRLTPEETIPHAGKNFEGRYLQAALEPAKEAWDKIEEKYANHTISWGKDTEANRRDGIRVNMHDPEGNHVAALEVRKVKDKFQVYAPGWVKDSKFGTRVMQVLENVSDFSTAKKIAEARLRSGQVYNPDDPWIQKNGIGKELTTSKVAPASSLKPDTAKPTGFKAEKLLVKVPDDGTFVIPNHPAAIDRAIDAADKFVPQKEGSTARRVSRSPEEFNVEKYITGLEREIADLEDSLKKAKGTTGEAHWTEQLKAARENLAEAKRKTPERAETESIGEHLAGESGTFNPSKLNPLRIQQQYRNLATEAIGKLGLTKYFDLAKVDKDVAENLNLIDNAPRWAREKAKANLAKVTEGLSEDQTRLASLMVDSDSRDFLHDKKPAEYQQAMNDPTIMAAVQRFKPLQDEMAQDRMALHWPVRRSLEVHEDPQGLDKPWAVTDRDGNHVESFKTKGAAQRFVEKNGKIEPHLKRTYPEHMRSPLPAETGAAPFTGSFYASKGLRPPGMDRKSRMKSAEYHYDHGAKDFSGYTESFIKTKEAILKQHLFDDFSSKATPWIAGTAKPPTIEYDGKTYYRPDFALQMRRAETEKSRQPVPGIPGKPPKDILEYSVYDPSRGERFLIRQLGTEEGEGFSTLTTGKPGIGPHDRFLGPKVVVDALENYDASRGGEGAGKLRKFFQEQIVGAFGPMVHVNNIMRRVGQVTGAGTFDPRSWPSIAKVITSPDLRARVLKGVDDSTIDMLVRRGAYTDWSDIGNLNAYVGGNLNPFNWIRYFGKGVLFDPKFMGGWGGLDPKARVIIADYFKDHYPEMGEKEVTDAVNAGLGEYNRANWSERQRKIARFTLFPGWDFGSFKWFIRHPWVTAMAPAIVTLAINLALHYMGKNKGDDEYDFGYVHWGDRKFRTGLLTESMAESLASPVLKAGEAALKHEDIFAGATEGAERGASSFAGTLAGPTVQMVANQLFNRKFAGTEGEIVQPQDKYEPGTWAPTVDLEKRISYTFLKGVPAVNRFMDNKGQFDWMQGLGSIMGATNYRYGGEERLRANAAKAADLSKALHDLNERDPQATMAFVQNPTRAAYLVLNGDLSQMLKNLKDIDTARARLPHANLSESERKETEKALDLARKQLLTSADALNEILVRTKLQKPLAAAVTSSQ